MALLPKVKIKALVSFPATVLDGVGVDVVKQNGAYQFNLAYDDFAPPVTFIADAPHLTVLMWNVVTQAYSLSPISFFGLQDPPSDGKAYGRMNGTWVAVPPEAPNDGVQYGRQGLAWTPIIHVAPATVAPLMDALAAVGVSVKYAREDHVHPSDTSRATVTYVDTQDALKANIASPTFTGDPKAPTPTAGDSDTSIATTAFVAAAVAAGGGGGGASGHGQCVLALSGGNLVLSPKNGNQIKINGVVCTVPDAGVSLAATGLTPTLNYYIYAVATAGAVSSLEASATAHAISTTAGNKGVEIKSGDDTRTLVGLARVVTGPAWADSVTQGFVLSWFNRGSKGLVNHLTASRSTNTTSFVEFHSEIRVEFLTWPDEVVQALVAASGYPSVSGHACFYAVGFDGATAEDGMAAISDGTGGSLRPVAAYSTKRLSEGYHYATVLGAVDSTTGAPAAFLYFQAASNGTRSALAVTIRG